MTDPIAARIIDDLIILLGRDAIRTGYHAIDRGLDYIAKARVEHQIPVTASLLPLLSERVYQGELTADDWGWRVGKHED